MNAVRGAALAAVRFSVQNASFHARMMFNPETQAQKFDGPGEYRKKFILELAQTPGPEAADYFRAVPRGWGLGTQAAYPDP
ncbi:MAG: hypothetical protein H5U20_09100, partial [Rhodobacteraceae bacterium]|nr:hypothetical protein [Paracoccaceae bacterium]